MSSNVGQNEIYVVQKIVMRRCGHCVVLAFLVRGPAKQSIGGAYSKNGSARATTQIPIHNVFLIDYLYTTNGRT